MKCLLQCGARRQHPLHSCLTSEPMLFLPQQGLVWWSIGSTSKTLQNCSAHCKSPVKVNEDSPLQFSLCCIPHGSASVEKQASKDTELDSTQKIIPILENCLKMEWAACPRRCLNQRWLQSETVQSGLELLPSGQGSTGWDKLQALSAIPHLTLEKVLA